jgi:class 3 adenylate cyclase/tetratricopeptide (TPR) repeat protein
MKCPECQFDNPDSMKFCGKCGSVIQLICNQCDFKNPPGFKFCGECGCELSANPEITILNQENVGETIKAEDDTFDATCSAPDSERKCVTVMFSDLTGYTEISEKLDPEEVKELTNAIFSELTKIIIKYDGFIEKYIGDAILAVFGAREAFEDSALRAIKAAREIHTYVQSVSPKYEKRIGRKLSMHTGINTGLVVTGEINYQKGTHGLVGDTINTASRLMSVSQAGEIITDHDSYVQTEGYFEFSPLNPVTVRGKAEPIKIYKVGNALQSPKKLHRLHGLRAELIGRSIEMQVLKDAAENLEAGKGSVVSVCGTAGTGKSRLVHEFKKTLDLKKIQWLDSNAYPYTQNTPYYPLIDLLTKAFGIKDGDNSEAIKLKVESNLESLLGEGSEKVPYIAGLFSIEYPETSEVSPEYWKDQLHSAVDDVLKKLTTAGPTVICLEDMHWADPSTMELVRKLVSNLSAPLMVICIYRPVITIFTDFEIRNLSIEFTELRLRELSPSESHDMVCSLLNADQIPKELRGFLRDCIDGNPFYVEELINALIDSEALSKNSGQWVLTKMIDDSFISTNIQGVIAGRIDRLNRDTKRILQEASVIGRAFLFDILQRISEIKHNIDKNLVTLERLDLISAKSIQPTLEYIFKHALTQEIVYNGLLKSERKKIHEKIGKVIEILFQDRLPEFFETLAYHYMRGTSNLKAVEYLTKSGEKSLRRYSLEEAHQYFSDAYNCVVTIEPKNNEINEALINLINNWAAVNYYRGEFTNFLKIAGRHAELADSIKNQFIKSLYYGWVGFSYDSSGYPEEGYNYLLKASEIAKSADDQRALAYCYTWLAWACVDLANLEEAESFGDLAVSLSNSFPKEHYLFFKSRAGLAHVHMIQGKIKKMHDIATNLIDYGDKHSNARSKVLGYVYMGNSHYLRGDYDSAITSFKTGFKVCRDIFYSMILKFYLGAAYLQSGNFSKAKNTLTEAYENGISVGGTPFLFYGGPFLGAAIIAGGNMQKGIVKILETKKLCIANKIRSAELMADLVLGSIYAQIIVGENALGIKGVIRNLGFIIQNVPGAMKKAENYLLKTITEGKKIGSDFMVSQACYELGLAYKAKNKNDKALKYLTDAKDGYERMGADINMNRVKTVIETFP